MQLLPVNDFYCKILLKYKKVVIDYNLGKFILKNMFLYQ